MIFIFSYKKKWMGKTICLAVIVKITKCSLLINVPVNQTIFSRRCDVKSGNIQGRKTENEKLLS